MKLKNTLALGFGLVLALSTQSYAAETVSNPINEDLFFSNGVQLQNVNETAEGVAEVDLEGTGSLTVGSQSSGGFPRVAISTGTKITSTRVWPAETVPKTSWDGSLSAPGSGRLPSRDELVFDYATNRGNQFEAVDAYVWGLSNETFAFSTAARFVFPVDEPDGQRLWLAEEADGTWTVDSTDEYCITDSGLCYLELTSMNGIALVKQLYDTCPRSSIINGSIGSIPNCIVTCDSGYFVDDEGDECLADSFGDSPDEGGDESESLGLEELSEAQQEELYGFADDYGIDPLEILASIPGNVRLRESGVAWQRYLPEYSDLTAEELEQVKLVNLGYFSRNGRSAAEQLAAGQDQTDPAVVRQKETSFMNYLLQTRNNFAKRAAEKAEEEDDEAAAEGVLEEGADEGSVAAGEEFHSSGGLLPSTGPGLFITIAIIGFLLMLFGGVRRN